MAETLSRRLRVVAHRQVPTPTVVIPALNEQEAIGGTITRCLDARGEIEEVAGLDDVEIIVETRPIGSDPAGPRAAIGSRT